MLPSQQNFLSFPVSISSPLTFLLHPCHLGLPLLRSPKLYLPVSPVIPLYKSNSQSLSLLLPATQKHWETHALPPSPKTRLPRLQVLLMPLPSLAGPPSSAPPVRFGYQDCSRISTHSPPIEPHVYLQSHSLKYHLHAHDSQSYHISSILTCTYSYILTSLTLGFNYS